MWVEDLTDEPDPAAALVADGVVTRAQIDAAMRYRAAYPDEIAWVSSYTAVRRPPPARGEAAARRDVLSEAR